jgi:glycosyltransferase involved in cell wall biosynthesis
VQLGKKNRNIIVTGYVKEIEPYIRKSAVLVCSILWGSGVRIKIFDAWARGIPVVSTTIGAEGIEFVPDEHLLIADNPEEFSEKVVRIIKDKELSRRLVVNGRRWVEEKYDWKVVYLAYERLYNDMLTLKSANGRGDIRS